MDYQSSQVSSVASSIMYDEHGKMMKNTVEAKAGKPLNENGKVVPNT
jgi:hypothetical protein